MPNHIINIIEAPREIIDLLVDDKGNVDFERIIPTPSIICQEMASFQAEDLARAVLAGTKTLDQAIAEALGSDKLVIKQYVDALKECGYSNWYTWNVAHWGTKWNAYETVRHSPKSVEFQTAWSAPHPVIEKLAEMTGADIRHEWADEDIGSNVGIMEYIAGDCINMDMGRTKEGFELAFKLWNVETENYELVDGEYRWKEDND